jgi:IS30 family transposase
MKGYHHLTRGQRYIIQELLEIGKPLAFIAREIGVHRSTLFREVRRNSGARGYFARGAHDFAFSRRPRATDLNISRKIEGAMAEIIFDKLMDGWSPEQISGRLKHEGKPSVSHETIYKYIYINKRLGGDLYKVLRNRGRRLRRGGRRNRLWIFKENRKFIERRCEEANQRTEYGHWERDLLNGPRGSPSLLTVVDRKSRYTILSLVHSKFASEVNKKTENLFKSRKNLICKSITNDNGPEFGVFCDLQRKLQVPVYYTHPYRSWERGTNENTNGLLRQYFPKKQPIDTKENELYLVENALNNRPRKMFSYKTPREILFTKQDQLIRSLASYRKQIAERNYLENIKTLQELKVAFGG